MAIALDGASAAASADKDAGQQRFGGLGRRPSRSAKVPVTFTDTHVGAKATPAGEQTEEDLATTESAAALAGQASPVRTEFAGLNAQLVKETFARVMADAQKAMEYFYACLFVRSPEIRAMFPLAMNELRERVFSALARLVWSLDSPEACTAYLGQLGRDHRRFGVKDKHYRAFFDTLMITVEHFSGPDWTAEARAAWVTALDAAAAAMRDAAAADAEQQPPWWVGEVVRHERRTESVAVLTIWPNQPLSHVSGQYLSVQVARWPRIWRNFSVANAPSHRGLLDLHVKAVPGGMVSGALVHHAGLGDTVLLGRARGEMTMPRDCHRDLVCVAGGTGLAPLKAIIESAIASANYGQRRNITLFLGARRQADLYDRPALEALQSRYPPLTVIPVVSHQPGSAGLRGLLPQVVRDHAALADSEVFISGPDGMVAQTERSLADLVPAERIHRDPLNATWGPGLSN